MSQKSMEAEARALAAKANLVVVAKRTARGDVRAWQVHRKMPTRLVYVGEAVNEARLLALVKRAAA